MLKKVNTPLLFLCAAFLIASLLGYSSDAVAATGSSSSKKTTVKTSSKKATNSSKKTTSSKKSTSSKKVATKSTNKKTTSKSSRKTTTSKALAAKAAKVKKIAQTYKPVDKFSALVVDAGTGRILYEKSAGKTRYPASLTKMMTLYLTFDALKRDKIELSQSLPVSEKAAHQPQTNIALEPGDRLQVRKAIESLVVRSANDSSVVLAEALGGTTWNFALMMNKKARELGMKNTVFRNPNGLPDNSQYTTAYDMARLGIALRRDFPEYYDFFSTESFAYNGVTYTSHNRVMGRYRGADGIKTGYIRASGFNLVTSVKKDGHNLVAVIMGGDSASHRDDMMVDMLDRTFAQLANKRQNVATDEDVSKEQPHAANDNVRKVALFASAH